MTLDLVYLEWTFMAVLRPISSQVTVSTLTTALGRAEGLEYRAQTRKLSIVTSSKSRTSVSMSVVLYQRRARSQNEYQMQNVAPNLP